MDWTFQGAAVPHATNSFFPPSLQMIWPSDFCLWPQTVSPPNRCCCGFGWWRCRGGVGRLGRRRCCRWRCCPWRCSGRFRRGRGRCGRGRRRCGRRPRRLRWFRRWLGRRLWRSALRSRGRRGRAPLRTAAAWAAVAALAADARFSVLWRRWALEQGFRQDQEGKIWGLPEYVRVSSEIHFFLWFLEFPNFGWSNRLHTQTLVVDSRISLFDTGRGRFFSSKAGEIPGGSDPNHGYAMYHPRTQHNGLRISPPIWGT